MLTQKRLHEIMEYDPQIGVAFWKDGRSRKNRGRVGCQWAAKRSSPYRRVNMVKELGRKVAFSRLVFFYMKGRWPKGEMDHLNGDTLDDRWENLRECSRSQNEANRGARSNNKLGVKGVYLDKATGRFRAKFYRGKATYLGPFDTIAEAQAAYASGVAAHDKQFFHR